MRRKIPEENLNMQGHSISTFNRTKACAALISDRLFLRHEINPTLSEVHTFNFTSHQCGFIRPAGMSGNDHDHSMYNLIS